MQTANVIKISQLATKVHLWCWPKWMQSEQKSGIQNGNQILDRYENLGLLRVLPMAMFGFASKYIPDRLVKEL